MNATMLWSLDNGWAHGANDRICYNTTTGVLSYDANDNAAGCVNQLVVHSNRAALSAADFFVI